MAALRGLIIFLFFGLFRLVLQNWEAKVEDGIESGYEGIAFGLSPSRSFRWQTRQQASQRSGQFCVDGIGRLEALLDDPLRSGALKTAWFMSHRIRLAMQTLGMEPMGGAGEIVEIDETLQGFQEGSNYKTKRVASQYRNVVLTLVQRGGSARSFHIEGTTLGQLLPIIRANVNPQSAVMTDAASWYKYLGDHAGFASHERVDHSEGEYVRGIVHTNTVEGYYSVFKRGMKGVYQHCKEKHLHRYLAEFDFRYSNRVALGVNDTERADRALKGIVGKRLTYETTGH